MKKEKKYKEPLELDKPVVEDNLIAYQRNLFRQDSFFEQRNEDNLKFQPSFSKLRIGTLFSGIGAFEEALKQLQIPHELKFACDNGEIEFIPFENREIRKEYKDLCRRHRRLDDIELFRYNFLSGEMNRIIDSIRQKCYTLKNNAERTKYINSLYARFSPLNSHNYVKDSYLANYNLLEENFHTDVRFIKGDEYLHQIDIMVGGSPCQSFSTYGNKMGLEDTRGTLFYDYARIIKECQPKIFIYENVAGLINHDKKRTWAIMNQVWESLGYVIRFQILNAKDYNHPQLRRRLFLIGFRKDVYTKEYVFPKTMKLTKTSHQFMEQSPVDDKYYLPEKGFKWVTDPSRNDRKARVNQDITGCQTAVQQDNWSGDLRVERPQPHHYTDDRIYIGQYDFGNGLEDAVARKMTPRECLRLMGFSDDFQIVVPDKIAYRQSGNSIVVPVLKEIIKTLLPYLD